jgi:hypothetical protein
MTRARELEKDVAMNRSEAATTTAAIILMADDATSLRRTTRGSSARVADHRSAEVNAPLSVMSSAVASSSTTTAITAPRAPNRVGWRPTKSARPAPTAKPSPATTAIFFGWRTVARRSTVVGASGAGRPHLDPGSSNKPPNRPTSAPTTTPTRVPTRTASRNVELVSSPNTTARPVAAPLTAPSAPPTTAAEAML